MATDGITSGKIYHLVNPAQKRGLTTRVHTNWDWAITSPNEDNGGTLIFHAYDGGGYLIESRFPHWDGYKYWTQDSKGIYLDKYDPATLWATFPTANGFLLRNYKSQDFVYSPGGDQYTKTDTWAQVSAAIGFGRDLEYILDKEPEKRKRFEFKVIPA